MQHVTNYKMKITYYGHASLGIEIHGKHLVVDPFISANPLASHLEVNSIPADYILLTHAHGDHVLDVETIARRTGATIISNAEIAGHYESKGFKAHGMNHGGSWTFDFGTLKCVNALHSSSFPDGSYGGNPMGFIVMSENRTLYIAGDTALTMDMKLIPMRYALDLAILPIGSNFTMDVDDAITAAQFLECDKVMGYHYDTFGFIKIDKDMAIRKFFANGKDLMLPAIGESITI